MRSPAWLERATAPKVLALGLGIVVCAGPMGCSRGWLAILGGGHASAVHMPGSPGRGLVLAANGHDDLSVSTFYPHSVRTNAQVNAGRYGWARKEVEDAIRKAEPWLHASDEALWRMIIPPTLKRAIAVNVNKGCPHCGMAMYGERGPRPYAWIAWVERHPWKVQCPNCGELFPKNDFGAFYESGINPKTGLFEPKRADRTRLFNTEHPDPGDPLHGYAVDDGTGWQRFPGGLGGRDWYIAYHTYFGRNGRVTPAIRSLAHAYAVTGQAKTFRLTGISSYPPP